MMRLLHWVLSPRHASTFPREWGQPPQPCKNVSEGTKPLFSVLFSDLGSDFYKKCGMLPGEEGWVVQGTLTTIWEVPPLSYESNKLDDEEWEWLDDNSISEIWAQETKPMLSDLVTASGYPSHQAFFTFFPDEGVATFQTARTLTYSEDGLAGPPPIPHWGVAKRPASSLETPTYATWALETHPKRTVDITRWRTTPADAPKLLEKIFEAARQAGTDIVEAWNLPQEILEVVGGSTSERQGHLSSVKWYGPEDADQVKWVFNEKYYLAIWSLI